MSWLTVTEVCRLLGISRSTWDKWHATGRAPRAKKLPNGSLRTREDWLSLWIDDLPEVA